MQILEESKKVKIGDIGVWEKNPRKIEKGDFERLKKQIGKFAQYKPLICYEENGKLITADGNMRIRALRELGHKDVWVTIVQFESEQEKIELSLSANDRAGYYDDDALAELVYPLKDEIDLADFKVDIDVPRIDLDNILKGETYKVPEEKEYDENIKTDNECPKCGYKW